MKAKTLKPPKLDKKRSEYQEGPHSAFNRAMAILGEHYDSYVIAVQTERNGMEWRAKNRTWSEGACIRMSRVFEQSDYVEGGPDA